MKTVASPWSNLSIAAWVQSFLNRGAPPSTTMSCLVLLLILLVKDSVMCLCCKVYADQWLQPKKLWILEAQGHRSRFLQKEIFAIINMQISRLLQSKPQKLEKWRAKQGASVKLQRISNCNFRSHFSLKCCSSGAGPYTLFCRFCRAALHQMSVQCLGDSCQPLLQHTWAVRVRSATVPAHRP